MNFAELGISNGCRNLTTIVENLRTLYTLTYECGKEDSDTFYTLEYISKLNDLERLSLIMSYSCDCNSEFYSKHLEEWLIPFLSRRPTLQMRENLLKEYLIKTSKEDLMPCLKLFKLLINSLNHQESNKVTNTFKEINCVSIIIDCIYSNEKIENIDLCSQLINELSKATDPSDSSSNLSSKSVKQSTQQNFHKIKVNTDQQRQIKELLSYLKAGDLFKKYGLNKTVSYIRESSLDVVKCRDALVKLTWFASKREKTLKMNEWIELMKDLQNLQSNIYKSLVSYHECIEIFLASLLGSRNLENINLAADWLRDIFLVDKEGAIKLAIHAAQEYFNAASNYQDPDIEFSKACIHLVQTLINESITQQKVIPESDLEVIKCMDLIKIELDLIKGIKIISSFDYSILPVQVRLAENRFEIIKDLLKKNENAYKSHELLISLAKVLQISDLNKVMLAIAEYSLEKKNMSVLTQLCNDLVKVRFN